MVDRLPPRNFAASGDLESTDRQPDGSELSDRHLHWLTGTVTSWLGHRGFGFISSDPAHPDIFVHHSVIQACPGDGYTSGTAWRFLEEGDEVDYQVCPLTQCLSSMPFLAGCA